MAAITGALTNATTLLLADNLSEKSDKAVRAALAYPPPQQRQPSTGNVSAKTAIDPLAAQPWQPVSNAGIVALWPLLTSLFSSLALYQQDQFLSEEAHIQALVCLDWLIWGEEEPVPTRLTVNKLLCGIALDDALPALTPVSLSQQQQILSWFQAIHSQMPAWHKLALADMRALILQRSGAILLADAPTQLTVDPAPYDLLLNDWPWPLTLVALPWLPKPLTIIWLINDLTG